jgi:hypothetical protein
MPSLDQPEKLEHYWNVRTVVRKVELFLAFIALACAIGFATIAVAEASDEVAAKPAGTVGAKLTAPTDKPGTLEATAGWSGLDPGEIALLCVADSESNVLGAALGSAGNDGKQTTTLTVAVPTATSGELTITTVRLESTPPEDQTAGSICTSAEPRQVGQPISGSVAVP